MLRRKSGSLAVGARCSPIVPGMKPDGPDLVSLRTQTRGYQLAVDRFKQAAAGLDAVAAYAPLFEALSWAASIDLRLGKLWIPDGKPLKEDWPSRIQGAEAVFGLRFARNTVHHDWADALRLDIGGRRYPRRYPLRYFEWVWRDVDELPNEGRRRVAYEDQEVAQAAIGIPVGSRASIRVRGGNWTTLLCLLCERKRSQATARSKSTAVKPRACSGVMSSSCPSG